MDGTQSELARVPAQVEFRMSKLHRAVAHLEKGTPPHGILTQTNSTTPHAVQAEGFGDFPFASPLS